MAELFAVGAFLSSYEFLFLNVCDFALVLTNFSLQIGRAAFRAKMKGHYKGEFNAAALLR